eukprot:gene6292-8665_t
MQENFTASSQEFCSNCNTLEEGQMTISFTKLRVSNLCCVGEERLIHSLLKPQLGILEVDVNIITRSAVVKHCTKLTPIIKILELLNSKYLGASVEEIDEIEEDQNDIERNENKSDSYIYSISSKLYELRSSIFLVIIWIIFIIGTIFDSNSFSKQHSVPINHRKHNSVTGGLIFLCLLFLGTPSIIYNVYISLYIRHIIDMNTLVFIAIIGTVILSDYFDSALLLVLFLSSDQMEYKMIEYVNYLINATTNKSRMPTIVHLVNGEKKPITDVIIGDIIIIRTGNMILCDGIVKKGSGLVNESSLTGESVPIEKKSSYLVSSGTILVNGYIEVEVTNEINNSTLNKLQQDIINIQTSKDESISKLINRFAQLWSPFLISFTILYFIIGGLLTSKWSYFFYNSLVLLVLTCPCALVVISPLATSSAIAAASSLGVLIKGSILVETIAQCKVVAIDKTGTLTTGLIRVHDNIPMIEEEIENETNINNQNDENSSHSFRLAAAIESKGNHPLSMAVVSAYMGCIAEAADKPPLPTVRDFKALEGVGVCGWVEVDDDWKYVAIGNERLLKSNGGKTIANKQQLEIVNDYYNKSNNIILLVSVDDELMRLISCGDTIRDSSISFITSLKSLNIETHMLT